MLFNLIYHASRPRVCCFRTMAPPHTCLDDNPHAIAKTGSINIQINFGAAGFCLLVMAFIYWKRCVRSLFLNPIRCDPIRHFYCFIPITTTTELAIFPHGVIEQPNRILEWVLYAECSIWHVRTVYTVSHRAGVMKLPSFYTLGCVSHSQHLDSASVFLR